MEVDGEAGVCGGGDSRKFYEDAQRYWSEVPATVDGMLGGFSHISRIDLKGSRDFLLPFLNDPIRPVGKRRALDCGAGIGRITRHLLLPIFETADLVEVTQKFVDAAPAYLGPEAPRVDRYICCGLESFAPEAGRYDVIWCQWVLGHLTDGDLASFLQRCKQGLSPNGMIVLKDNAAAGERDFDSTDSSYTRTRDEFVACIAKAGLTVVKESQQTDFPEGLYAVLMLACR